MAMRIQYCSDLHLEFEQNNDFIIKNQLSVCGDILILAGDIVPLHDELLTDPFFRFISDNYKKVFWVPGNHEFYHRNMNEFSNSFNIELNDKISIVHNVELYYEDIRFIFSTMWSKISRSNEKIIEQCVSDFKCIANNNRNLKAKDVNVYHEESFRFIQQSLTNKKCRTVLVTHHSPSLLCNSAAHNNSPINEAFCADLTDFIEKSEVNFWIYGHSHFNQKPLFIGNTIMLTNQLGYVHINEHNEFKPNAYFAL
jgi:Icc-related predicted phosphoesterase